jgi:cobalt-zinc-cadmium efflux system protein
VHAHPADAHATHGLASERRLLLVLGLTAVYMLAEVASGLLTHSLALLADSGHLLGDVVGLAMAVAAIRFARRPATSGKTYGFYRAEILAALLNSTLLLGVAVWIGIAAVERLSRPLDIDALPMLLVACGGVAVTLIGVKALGSEAAESLNVRGAFLEVLGDLLGSLGTILAALIILATGWTLADPLISCVIGVLILPRTWRLLRDSVDVLLEATPRGIDMAEVRRHILEADGVAAVHDLHAWTITSGMNVVSAHVVLNEEADPGTLIDHLSDCLAADFDIDHSTFQLETPEHVVWEGRAARAHHERTGRTS